MKYLVNKLVNHKHLLLFTFLNYIDKLISFSLPLFVLYISKSQLLYNDIEYIFSIASILVVFFDLGLNTYYFFGYKESTSKDLYIENVKQYFTLSIIFYQILGLLLILTCLIIQQGNFLIPFVIIRILYLLVQSFYSSYFRLNDKPSHIYWLSIPVNLFAFIILFLLKDISSTLLFWIFLPQLLLLWILTYYFIIKRQKIVLNEIKSFFIKALKYSWPIIINVSMVTFINNFGKIYAYNYLSSDEMYQISYVLRISLIIQMAHVSIIAFYSKSIYIDIENKINITIFKKYVFFMFIAVLLLIGFILGINKINYVKPITINLASLLIIVYTILWCFRSYFEMYMGKYNKNKLILLFSIIATLIYTGYILILGIDNFLQLSIIMLLSGAISFILSVCYLKFFLFIKD